MNIANLKNIDFKKLTEFLKKNYDKDAGLYTGVLLIIIFFGIQQFVMPSFTKLGTNFSNYNQKKVELQQYIEKDKAMGQPKTEHKQQKLPINIYKSPYPDMDLESASVELVEKVIKIIRQTGNAKINQVNFSTQELTDTSGTNAEEYGILRLTLSIEGTYKSIKDMFNEIFLMNYLIVIKNINIEPKENSNNEFINAVITLDLYIKKN